MRRELENLAGLGKLFDGSVLLGKVQYRVRLSVDVLQAGNQQLDGLGNIEGRIVGGDVDLFGVMIGDPELTLELEDGRRWDCILQNSDGRLINRGQGLYRP